MTPMAEHLSVAVAAAFGAFSFTAPMIRTACNRDARIADQLDDHIRAFNKLLSYEDIPAGVLEQALRLSGYCANPDTARLFLDAMHDFVTKGRQEAPNVEIEPEVEEWIGVASNWKSMAEFYFSCINLAASFGSYSDIRVADEAKSTVIWQGNKVLRDISSTIIKTRKDRAHHDNLVAA